MFSKFYETLNKLGSYLKSPLLLFMRVYWGWLFMQAGFFKFQDIGKFISQLEAGNFIFPHFFAYLVASTEFICGLLLVIGLFSRIASIPLIIVMIVAYLKVHHESLSSLGAFVADGPFNFLLTCLIVLAFGPGRFSIDYLIGQWCGCTKSKC